MVPALGAVDSAGLNDEYYALSTGSSGSLRQIPLAKLAKAKAKTIKLFQKVKSTFWTLFQKPIMHTAQPFGTLTSDFSK